MSADGVLDKSTIDRIMLRFRPIAPKPAGYGDGATSEGNISSGKSKRKYVRRIRKNKKRKKASSSPAAEKDSSGNDKYKNVVTLQLLPETPDGEDLSVKPIESRVTVECVTDTCVDGEMLGLTDGDRIKNLEGDACPGFVSDGSDSVYWVNEAYKKLVMGGENGGSDGGWWKKEFRVVLVVMRERLAWNCFLCRAFGCRVRVEYTWRDRKWSRTVPCDVWRMDGGGFAWRLDVKAALSLSI